MEGLISSRVFPNDSHLLSGCDGSLQRPSCAITPAEAGTWDMVAALRMVISCLSILGASSIIGSVVMKREITNPKVHPIFSLALADLLLALLWIVGGVMWLRGISNRNWCFAVSLLTVILVCVSVNLTVVYALLTYSIIKRTDLVGMLANMDSNSNYGWGPTKTVLVYSTAWGLPVLIVMVFFAIVAGSSEIVQNTNSCSCWCAPVLGNVLPYAIHREKGTAAFVHDIRKLVVAYGGVIASHFLVGFILLVIVYWKTLRWIRNMKNSYGPSRTSYTYGTEDRAHTWSLISRGESKARKRVFYFLTAFAVSGFFNFVFSFGFMIREIIDLRRGEKILADSSDFTSSSFEPFYITFATLQAVSITQQGFLNAIVYGWTREDFLHTMAFHRNSVMNSVAGTGSSQWDDPENESGELGATWVMRSEKHEGGGEGEKDPLQQSSKSVSVTPTLAHKLYMNPPNHEQSVHHD